MQIAGREFRRTSDNEYGEDLLVWSGDVVANAKQVAETVAKEATEAGYRWYAATTEQRGEYPVVYLLPVPIK